MRVLRVLASLLRLSIAGLLFALCVQHLPSVDARLGFEALPDYDYYAEAERLRADERFSEALLVADAGRATVAGSNAIEDARYAELQARIAAERDDWLRRLGDVGEGALSGTGDSTEALVGAVAADLFVFGDVRDLVIQGGRKLQGEAVDEVIVALSAAGIVLTAAPSLDLGAALLKFARKVGALTESFARQIARLARDAVSERSIGPLSEVADDAATLSRSARPAGAIAILKHVDDPVELRRAAAFSQREGGSFALWIGEKPALDMLARGADAEAWLLRAARKGRAGIDYAASRLPLLARPHPLIGLIKGFYKGNVPDLLARMIERHAAALMGLLGGWLGFEVLLLLRRLSGGAARRKRPGPEIVTEPAPLEPRRKEPRLF